MEKGYISRALDYAKEHSQSIARTGLVAVLGASTLMSGCGKMPEYKTEYGPQPDPKGKTSLSESWINNSNEPAASRITGAALFKLGETCVDKAKK